MDKLRKSNDNWSYCKLQIHWNKIEWFGTKNRNKKKNILCTSY